LQQQQSKLPLRSAQQRYAASLVMKLQHAEPACGTLCAAGCLLQVRSQAGSCTLLPFYQMAALSKAQLMSHNTD
jgi:hypothetical protein